MDQRLSTPLFQISGEKKIMKKATTTLAFCAGMALSATVASAQVSNAGTNATDASGIVSTKMTKLEHPSAAVRRDRAEQRGIEHSVAREWNELLLDSIRRDFARPTVHALSLIHI